MPTGANYDNLTVNFENSSFSFQEELKKYEYLILSWWRKVGGCTYRMPYAYMVMQQEQEEENVFAEKVPWKGIFHEIQSKHFDQTIKLYFI